MAYGRSSTGGPTFIPAPGPGSTSSNGSSGSKTFGIAPMVLLLVFGALYLLWAVVERHERVQSAIQPKALALNARNLIAILLPVIFGIPLLKVAAAKYKALGGPGGDTVVSYFGAL